MPEPDLLKEIERLRESFLDAADKAMERGWFMWLWFYVGIATYCAFVLSILPKVVIAPETTAPKEPEVSINNLV